jgi:hypothetical protein
MSILFPMNVIEETRHAHQIIYIRFCYHRSVDTSDGGLLVPDGITHAPNYIRFCYHRSVDTSDGGLLVPNGITHAPNYIYVFVTIARSTPLMVDY